MIRLRRSVATTAVLALGSLSGCGTLVSTDTAARVGDSVLTQDQLAAIIDGIDTGAETPVPTGDVVDMNLARAVIQTWVIDELVTAEAADRGLDVPPFDGDPNDPEVIISHTEQTFGAISQDMATTPPTEQELAASYETLRCYNAVQVADEDSADTVLAALHSGQRFADVVTSQSIEVSGFLGCSPPDAAAQVIGENLGEPAIAALGDELAAAQPGDTVGPIVGQNGILVFQRPLVEELDAEQINQVVQASFLPQLIDTHDVEIASMYGAFSLVQGVVPLGGGGTTQLGG